MEHLCCVVCKETEEVEENTIQSSEFVGDYICDICENQGWWLDPAGGLHNSNEDDPAIMYE